MMGCIFVCAVLLIATVVFGMPGFVVAAILLALIGIWRGR